MFYLENLVTSQPFKLERKNQQNCCLNADSSGAKSLSHLSASRLSLHDVSSLWHCRVISLVTLHQFRFPSVA